MNALDYCWNAYEGVVYGAMLGRRTPTRNKDHGESQASLTCSAVRRKHHTGLCRATPIERAIQHTYQENER